MPTTANNEQGGSDNGYIRDAGDQVEQFHWAPVTTRLLECGGSMAWNVMDHVIPTPVDFVEQLRLELNQHVLRRLQPARTQGQVQAQKIISLLARFTNGSTITAQQDGLVQVIDEASVGAPINQVRGDQSIFISREERCQSNFIKSHPHLMHLIQTLEGTVVHHLSHCFDFDLHRTSVQLAVYPGDAQSGYPRHCDRASCQEETQKAKGTADHQRIITCVYYLTPEDWNVQMDGGCLRLFQNSSTDWFDVAPYSNRLVIFRSDGVEHQVLPSLRRPRTALTIWMYGSIKSSLTVKIASPQIDSSNVGEVPSARHTEESAISTNTVDRICESGPPPLCVTSDNSQFKIFVSIAAYRDSEIVPTLRSIFREAKHPERIFVGLVLQIDTVNKSEDQAIIESLHELATTTTWYNAQVRTITMDARHAQGPCYARYLCQSLHRGEDFVLQIDSHMRFRSNWDSYLIEQLHACSKRNKKVILTAYPVGYQLPNQVPNEYRGTMLVPWKFDDQGILRQCGRLLRATNSNSCRPIPCLLYAAGFNFAPASVLEYCPYQMMLRHMFFGEELSMAVRLYTWGFDLFAPSESVCYHLWSRAHRPTKQLSKLANGESSLETDERAAREYSHKILKDQVAGRGPGLGSERSTNDFARALKVNFDERYLEEGAELGGLAASSFAELEVFTSPNELGGKVFELAPEAKSLIASFLEQLG